MLFSNMTVMLVRLDLSHQWRRSLLVYEKEDEELLKEDYLVEHKEDE